LRSSKVGVIRRKPHWSKAKSPGGTSRPDPHAFNVKSKLRLSQTENATMPSVFLSHTRADKAFARKLGDDLARNGLKVWIDEAEIKIGESLIGKISEGINSADYLAVILSPDSVRSEWVAREVEIALTQEINGNRMKVLPLLVRQCKVPSFLSPKLFADFTKEETYEASLELLVESVIPYRPLIHQIEEITLGLRPEAITAFVARCARRMSPVYGAYFKMCSRAHLETIEAAVVLAERFAFETVPDEMASIRWARRLLSPPENAAGTAAKQAEELIFDCALAADAAKQAGVKQARHAAKGIRAAVKTTLASDSRYARRTASHTLDLFREIAPTSRDATLLLKVHLEELYDLRRWSLAEMLRLTAAKPLWPNTEPNWIRNPT
jgi:TIR domain